MKTRITLEVNPKIYSKVLWILSQFKVQDVRIVDEYAEQKKQFGIFDNGGSEFIEDEKLGLLLQDIEVNYESVKAGELV